MIVDPAREFKDSVGLRGLRIIFAVGVYVTT